MRIQPGSRRAARIVATAFAAVLLAVVVPSVSAQASSPTRSVPLVVGWSASGAETSLSAHGFRYSVTPPKGQSVKTPSKWTVTSQTPKGHAKAKVGTKVALRVVKTSVYLSQGVRSFYAKDYGTFTTTSEGGIGNATIGIPAKVKAFVVKVSYSGTGEFRLLELGKSGVATGRVPIKSTGKYSGTIAIGLAKVKIPTTTLRFVANGAWHVTVLSIAKAPIIARPAHDSGDHVYLYSGPSGIWTVRSPGPTTFTLNQTSSSSFPNLAVDESGSWAGKIALEPGPSVIEIHSNGTWSIT